MRIACLYLSGFAVQVERRIDPALCGKPVIIGGYHHETGRVREVSGEAAAFGVTPDMLLRQAYQLCPAGTFLPYREEKYREVFSSVLLEVAQLCPLVEPEPPAHIMLGLRYERDGRRFVVDVMTAIEWQPGFQSSCGIASSRFAARIASEDAGPSQVLAFEDGEERAFLRDLPVGRLSLSAAVVRKLQLFGIARAGELLHLPAGALEAQFGKEGQALLEIVRGEDNRDVEQWKGVREIVRTRCFDAPVGHGGELLEATRGLLEALCRGLQAQWQCCGCLALTFILEGGEVKQEDLHLKEPSSSPEVLWRRLMPCIEWLAGAISVEELRLTASDLCSAPGTQSSFLDGPRRATAQFNEAVGVLQQRYGRDVVKKVVARRGGRLPEERFSFVPCDPEKR
jgi:DNA polymerase-4